MVPVIETITQMNTFIAIALVVRGKGRQDSQFDPRGITVLLDGANDFDGTPRLSLLVVGLDYLPKSTLTE